MKKSLNEKIEEIFAQVGEFGPYQLLVFILVGITAFIPAIVGYSYSFYAATPNFRCKISHLDNDTYEVRDSQHREQIELYVPLSKDTASYRDIYDKCNIKVYAENDASSNYTLSKCNEFVYSREYFDATLMTEWNLVCGNSSKKSFFSTLYFLGTYGVLLNGILSDRFGRKIAAYGFMIASSVLNIMLAILVNVDWQGNQSTQQLIFGILRFATGVASNVYAVAVVIAVEICGVTKRVTAANCIYYLYIAGEVLVVIFAYFIRDYRRLVIAFSAVIASFVFYFWIVPESPRWLLTKGRYSEAYKVFKTIANSNKKPSDCLNEIELLKEQRPRVDSPNAILPLVDEENQALNRAESASNQEKHVSFGQTLRVFFKSRKLILTSFVTLLNWLTNTLVYYGISFNTSDLVGDPYLNFVLSIVVELCAILACQFTLERFGRKLPYSLNMAISGVCLISVMFVPTSMPYLITVLALIGKFSISFTYNSIYIITAEMYPTVIRNSAVSICQTFARFGAVISPYIQLLGDKWYPMPFIVYGTFSTLSAISFVALMPETKDKKLPDTIEEFVDNKH